MRAHVYVCTGVCVCVFLCVCVCARMIEKGIWALLPPHAHLHNGQAPALGAEEVRGKLIEDQESETGEKTSKTITDLVRSYA